MTGRETTAYNRFMLERRKTRDVSRTVYGARDAIRTGAADMNITEYAKQMGTSKTTLYRKISDAGIDVSTLRDANGQITDDGLSTLSALLDGTLQRRNVSRTVYVPDTPENDVILSGKIAELERQLYDTRAALDAANARIAALQQQAAERERENADAWKHFSERQQQIEAQRLLAAQAGENRRGFFGHLHDKLFGVKQPTAPTQRPTDSDQN